MKLRLLKPLPGADIGTVSFWNDTRNAQFGELYYECEPLISTGWAEEVKDALSPIHCSDSVFIVGSSCNIKETSIYSDNHLEILLEEYKFGLCTKTREELETTLLLLKLRQSNGGWKPKEGELYYNLAIGGCVVFENFEEDDDLHVNDILIGNCYRTREEAEKYAPEWKKLFDSVK